LKSKINWLTFEDPFRTVQLTHRLRYKNQSVSAVYWSNGCLFWDSHSTHTV